MNHSKQRAALDVHVRPPGSRHPHGHSVTAAAAEADVIERLTGDVDAKGVQRRNGIGPEVEAESAGTKLGCLFMDLHFVAVALQRNSRCQASDSSSHDGDAHRAP
jgi:hypothetical protein